MANHRVVASGSWRYADDTWLPVRIVESTYDFWFEIAKADDELDPGEKPKLNPEGLVYYVVVRPYSPSDTFWPDSVGFMSLNEARRGAASMLAGPLDWSRSSEFPVHGSSQSPEWVQRLGEHASP